MQRPIRLGTPGYTNWPSLEFVVLHKIGGRRLPVALGSHYVREDGRWFYLDGETPDWID